MKYVILSFLLLLVGGCNNLNSYSNYIVAVPVKDEHVVGEERVIPKATPALVIPTPQPKPTPFPLPVLKTVEVIKKDKANVIYICPPFKAPVTAPIPDLVNIKSELDLVNHIKLLRLYIRDERIKREKAIVQHNTRCKMR